MTESSTTLTPIPTIIIDLLLHEAAVQRVLKLQTADAARTELTKAISLLQDCERNLVTVRELICPFDAT